jgi:hypothetical protein
MLRGARGAGLNVPDIARSLIPPGNSCEWSRDEVPIDPLLELLPGTFTGSGPTGIGCLVNGGVLLARVAGLPATAGHHCVDQVGIIREDIGRDIRDARAHPVGTSAYLLGGPKIAHQLDSHTVEIPPAPAARNF